MSWDSHTIEQPALAILVQPSAAISLALLTHDDGADDTFDRRRVGLDHLRPDVNGINALRARELTPDASNVRLAPQPSSLMRYD